MNRIYIDSLLSEEQVKEHEWHLFELSCFTTRDYKTNRYFIATTYEQAITLMREVAQKFVDAYKCGWDYDNYDIPSCLIYPLESWMEARERPKEYYSSYVSGVGYDESLIVQLPPRTVEDVFNYMLKERWLYSFKCNTLCFIQDIDGD